MKSTLQIISRSAAVATLAVGLLSLASCGNSTNSGRTAKRLNGAGSSFVAPIMKKWASEYHKSRGTEIDYTSAGSGNGVKQMVDQKNDFGCTDAPMNQEQLEQAANKGGSVVHIPLVMGGVVPIYNLPGIEKPLRFTGEVLADIFLGKIKKWNEEPLVKLNEGIDLPDLPIATAHRSDASGTSYIWTDYLSKVSSEWKEKVGMSTSPSWPVGAGAVQNKGVAGLVAGTRGGIGYAELIYALGEKAIQYGAVQNKQGKYVQASLETVTAAAAGLKDIPDDLRFSLTNADGAEAYPISGTVWMVLYVKQAPEKGTLLAEFARWVTHEGQDLAKELHYARLPTGLVERVEKKIQSIEGQTTTAAGKTK